MQQQLSAGSGRPLSRAGSFSGFSGLSGLSGSGSDRNSPSSTNRTNDDSNSSSPSATAQRRATAKTLTPRTTTATATTTPAAAAAQRPAQRRPPLSSSCSSSCSSPSASSSQVKTPSALRRSSTANTVAPAILNKKPSITFTAVTRTARATSANATPSYSRHSGLLSLPPPSSLSSPTGPSRPTPKASSSASIPPSTPSPFAPSRPRLPLAPRQDAVNKMRNLNSLRPAKEQPSPANQHSKNMPFDRSAQHSTDSSLSRQQPQKPTLAKRPPPVTPKIASRSAIPGTTTSQGQHQTVTATVATTPAPRRPPRPASVLSNGSGLSGLGNTGPRTAARPAIGSHRKSLGSISSISHHNTTKGKDKDRDRDDVVVSPSRVSAFLHSNVTPRSGPRQSRVDSASNSPGLADASSDNSSWETRSGLGISGGHGFDPDGHRRNGPTLASAAAAPGHRMSITQQQAAPPPPVASNRDTKFFYASDAGKSTQAPASVPSRPVPGPQKGPAFFYANGENLPEQPPQSAPPMSFSPSRSGSSPDPLASKFFYANGSPDLQPSLMSSHKPTRAPSVVSTSSRMTSSKTASGAQSPAPFVRRDPSPIKSPSVAPLGHHSTPSLADRRGMLSSTTPQLGHPNKLMRRVSLDTPCRRISGSHARSGSLIAEPPSMTRVLSSGLPSSESPIPSPMSLSNPGLTMASILQAAEDMADHEDNDSLVSGLTSPKSAHGNDPLNDLVANARRERKVQDLQITNASLEAINRTLERQLRKQTAELRRYKRLSRAGRLSAADPTAESSRVTSGSTTASSAVPQGPLNKLDLGDLSGEDDDSDADPEFDELMLESELSESESTGSAELSTGTVAQRDARHRKRDEKRLQIDLSKHHQLLVDSQKMNQSLKRCLGWTEELIKEGKRALAYQVRVSEVDASGHPVEADETEQQYVYDGPALWDRCGRSDASADEDETVRLRLGRVRSSDDDDESEGKGPQDRDSGIVLPGEFTGDDG